VIALLVLLGSAYGARGLTSLGLPWPGMQATTAVGLFFAGVALWLRSYDDHVVFARRAASAAAALVMLVGVIALVERLYGTDLRSTGPLARTTNGIAPSEAIDFLLAGGALLLVDTETRFGRRPTELFALVLFALTLPVFVSFLYGALPRADTEMTGLSAVAFILLSAGLLFARPRRGLAAVLTGASMGGTAARRLLPAMLVLPVVLGAILLASAAGHMLPNDWVTPMFASLVALSFASIGVATALSFHRSDADRRRSEARLSAQNAATRALIERNSVAEAIPMILSSFGENVGWDVGVLWQADRDAHVLRCTQVWHRPELDVSSFEARARDLEFAPGVGTPGQVWTSGEPAWVPDVPRFPGALAKSAEQHGLHASLAFPIRNRTEVTGVMEFFTHDIRDLDPDLVAASSVLGSQVGEAIERKRSDEALRAARDAAESSNRELEAFSYSVSHDLQSPLTRIDNLSQALLEEAGERLDDKSRDYVLRVRAAAQRTSHLVDELLELSRASSAELQVQHVDVSALARAVASEVKSREPGRKVDIFVQEGMFASGDPGLLRGVLENLIGNAWKFTSKRSEARIDIGARQENGATVFFVRDDGVGFDPAYGHLLFGPFQRLHKESDFPGSGIGLAMVQRIVRRHGGRVWADGATDRGATFSFTIPERTT
jgi:signal transduction histidine kinase